MDDLPNNWTWERFQVLPLEHGLIALYNVHHNGFLRGPSPTSSDKLDELSGIHLRLDLRAYF